MPCPLTAPVIAGQLRWVDFWNPTGAYQIVNTNSNKCVSVGGSQTNKGARIIQWDCSTSRLDDLWYPRAA